MQIRAFTLGAYYGHYRVSIRRELPVALNGVKRNSRTYEYIHVHMRNIVSHSTIKYKLYCTHIALTF